MEITSTECRGLILPYNLTVVLRARQIAPLFFGQYEKSPGPIAATLLTLGRYLSVKTRAGSRNDESCFYLICSPEVRSGQGL